MFSITHLNDIHHTSYRLDGYMESNTNSPDIIFNIPSLPPATLRGLYNHIRVENRHIYQISSPLCHHKIKRNPLKKSYDDTQ